MKHVRNLQPEHGFTLIEVLVSVTLAGLILTSAYASFQGIIKSQIRLTGTMSIQKGLFFLNEKLASLIHNGGTLDYEEYFNRRILGYEKEFNADNIWTYTYGSKYGNGDTVGRPDLYLCGKDSRGDEEACLGSNSVSLTSSPPPSTYTTNSLIGIGPNRKHMAFGQYREIGFYYGTSAGYAVPQKLPLIFPPDTTSFPADEMGINDLFVQEISGGTPQKNFAPSKTGISDLYLIKKLPNGMFERTFFRHIFVQEPLLATTKSCNPSVSFDGCLGKLQMTKLVSCDSVGTGADGVLDAWAEHPDFGGESDPCSSITAENAIPSAADDLIWVDINSPDMNVVRAQFLPSPHKIPTRMSGVGEAAFSPTVQLYIEVKLSQRVLTRGLLQESENPTRFLLTTFDLGNT